MFSCYLFVQLDYYLKKKQIYFKIFLNYFNMLISKIKKNIILLYFQVKNILKNNLYHNFKLTLSVCLIL